MMVDIAKLTVNHGQALEVMTDGQFFRHAHTAVDLNGLLPNEAARLTNANFRSRRGFLSLNRIFAKFQGRHIGH